MKNEKKDNVKENVASAAKTTASKDDEAVESSKAKAETKGKGHAVKQGATSDKDAKALGVEAKDIKYVGKEVSSQTFDKVVEMKIEKTIEVPVQEVVKVVEVPTEVVVTKVEKVTEEVPVEKIVEVAKAETEKAAQAAKTEAATAKAGKEAAEKDLADAKDAHAKKMADLKAEHDKEIADAKAAHEKALADTKADHEKAVKAEKDRASKAEEQVATVTAEHTKLKQTPPKIEKVKEEVAVNKVEKVKEEVAVTKVEKVKEEVPVTKVEKVKEEVVVEKTVTDPALEAQVARYKKEAEQARKEADSLRTDVQAAAAAKPKVIEVVKEVPVEKIKEVVKEVPVEKIKEVVKEVPVEKIVEVAKAETEKVAQTAKTEAATAKAAQEKAVAENDGLKKQLADLEKDIEGLRADLQKAQAAKADTEQKAAAVTAEHDKLKAAGPKIEKVTEQVVVEKIKEVPVEKIVVQEKVVEVVKEVPVEKIVEIEKEIPVETIVTQERVVEVADEYTEKQLEEARAEIARLKEKATGGATAGVREVSRETHIGEATLPGQGAAGKPVEPKKDTTTSKLSKTAKAALPQKEVEEHFADKAKNYKGAVPAKADGSTPDASLKVKGDEDAMLFFEPADEGYAQVEAEFYFKTPAEATAAGFKPGKDADEADRAIAGIRTPSTKKAKDLPEDKRSKLYSAAAARHKGAGASKSDGSAPSAEYTIKGNEDSMLYHMPDTQGWRDTIAEFWFKTEADAKAAGFKPVPNPRPLKK